MNTITFLGVECTLTDEELKKLRQEKTVEVLGSDRSDCLDIVQIAIDPDGNIDVSTYTHGHRKYSATDPKAKALMKLVAPPPPDSHLLIIAKGVLRNNNTSFPATEAEIFAKAAELASGSDFLLSHMMRLQKEWRDFSDDDWTEIIQISGLRAITNNIGALTACLLRGLIDPNSIDL